MNVMLGGTLRWIRGGGGGGGRNTPRLFVSKKPELQSTNNTCSMFPFRVFVLSSQSMVHVMIFLSVKKVAAKNSSTGL